MLKGGMVQKVQKRLENELRKLKTVFGLDPCLKVTWVQSTEGSLSGEIKGRQIFIYEVDEEKALQTLRHEALDYLISNAIEPYKKVTNKMIKLVNEEAYERKEKLIRTLFRKIDWSSEEDIDGRLRDS